MTLKEKVKRAIRAAWKNGYDLQNLNDEQIAIDLSRNCAELENVSISALTRTVYDIRTSSYQLSYEDEKELDEVYGLGDYY